VVGRRYVTVVTALVTLLASALTWRMTVPPPEEVVAEVGEAAGEEAMKEGVFATDATGLDISPGSALRAMVVETTRGEEGVEEEEDLYAIGAIGWDISPESALRERVTKEEVEVEEVAEEEEEETEIMEVVEDLSATSAIGSGISQESAVRRRIAATSATAPGTLQGTAARTKTLATIATRHALQSLHHPGCHTYFIFSRLVTS